MIRETLGSLGSLGSWGSLNLLSSLGLTNHLPPEEPLMNAGSGDRYLFARRYLSPLAISGT